MNKILIIGPTGAGKSTTARKLEDALDIPAHDLDQLYWQPGWKKRPLVEFRADVQDILEQDRWIIEGVQDEVRNDILDEADTLIWVDTPLLTHFTSLVARTFNRIVHNKEICNGNKEPVSRLFSSESVFIQAARTRREIKSELTHVFRATANDNQNKPEPPYDNIENFIRLSSREEAADFLENLSKTNDRPRHRP